VGINLQLGIDFPSDPSSVADFVNDIPLAMSQPPWNYNGTLITGQNVSLIVMLHDKSIAHLVLLLLLHN